MIGKHARIVRKVRSYNPFYLRKIMKQLIIGDEEVSPIVHIAYEEVVDGDRKAFKRDGTEIDTFELVSDLGYVHALLSEGLDGWIEI